MKDILKFIPGFRTKTKWKILMSVVFYGFGLLSITFGVDKLNIKEQTVTADISVNKENENNSKNSTVPSTEKSTESIKSPEVTSTPQAQVSTNTGGELKVHFIDVGQADSILVQQGSDFMLVDAGNNEDTEIIEEYLNKQGVKELKYFVGTHKDEDHIGSADYIINSFKVGKVIFPKQTATTKTYKDFITSVKNKGLSLTVPKVGENFKLGEADVTILAPNSATYEDANDYSIVLMLQYKNNKFLLTGDAEAISEMEMVKKGLNLKADLLKVGHHGSKSSTTENFLRAVSPKYAVVSVGKDNSYGHPAQNIVDRLKNANVKLYRTDESGTVIATSDGNNISFTVNKAR